MVRRRIGKIDESSDFISLDKIKDLNSITEEKDGIRIFCRATHSDILDSLVIKNNFPILIDAVSEIGSTQIRNRGSLVGNVVNASPAGDGILALFLLDAILEIVNSEGDVKNIKVEDFITGPGKTMLQSNEYVRSVKIPFLNREYHQMFRKIGQRKAMAISIASMGLLIETRGDKISDLRIAFGSVAPKVLRLYKAEKEAFGRNLDLNTVRYLSNIVFEEVSPIDDIRSSAEYRRKVCRNLVLELEDTLNINNN